MPDRLPEQRTERARLFQSLPPEWPDETLADQIAARVIASGRTVVALDDDPTGVQTVHDVAVLTTWRPDVLAAELRLAPTIFFVLTNSRALPRQEAEELAQAIAANLCTASEQVGREFVVLSRSDSTLRGHYPAEMRALAQALGGNFDGEVIAPAFFEGGRFTIGNIHWVAQGDWLVPAGQTEFARDPVFGYRSSYLPEWIEEKTMGAVRAEEVVCLELDTIRRGGPAAVAQQLGAVTGYRPVVVNAASYRDLEVVVLGLLEAEAWGKRFLYRTAAGFARVRGAISPRGLLTAAELYAESTVPSTMGGLVIVGSHVRRTTEQLETLLARPGVVPLQLAVEEVLDAARHDAAVRSSATAIDQAVAEGKVAVLYTSRTLVTGASEEENVAIAHRVSMALVSVLKAITVRPRFIVAKGGITSSDLATEGLGVKRAIVRGQIAPGVPVWVLGEDTPYPGTPYVIFPGNVGDASTLATVVATLQPELR